jgi:hypothetical protein
MPIFKSAYDTTVCSGYRLKETIDKLKAGAVTGAFMQRSFKLDNFDQEIKMALVEGGNTNADVVPYFNHPLFIKDENSSTSTMFIDARNFGKWYAPQQKFIVRNYPEYSWQICRAALNHIWMYERADLLKDISIIPASVYAALISESVSRKFALDAGEQAIVAVVACYFYYCLFTDERNFDETEFNKVAGNIARATKVSAVKVFDIIEGLKVISDLSELCEVLKVKTNSIRLVDFNIGVLLAIASGTWFGTNARENLGVALEHPPTWLMICYASLTEATYKRSTLAKVVERFTKGGTGNDFIKSMDSLLSKHKLLENVNNESM